MSFPFGAVIPSGGRPFGFAHRRLANGVEKFLTDACRSALCDGGSCQGRASCAVPALTLLNSRNLFRLLAPDLLRSVVRFHDRIRRRWRRLASM